MPGPAMLSAAFEFAVAFPEPGDEADGEVVVVPKLLKELVMPDAVVPEFEELVTPVLPTAVASPKFEELRIPELLTELHGTDVPVAPRARGTPDAEELPGIVDKAIPPPSKLGSVAEPALFVEHGAEFKVPE